MRKLHPDLDFDIFEHPTPQMIANIEAAIEYLIAIRDALDVDPDLEAGGDDEPWLGWCRFGQGDDGSSTDDREADRCFAVS